MLPRPSSTLQEAGLLSPFTRSLTLLGRERVLGDLTAWLEAPHSISVQVVVGGGGRGKTRLALELCTAAGAKGWLAGFVTAKELERFHRQQALATWGWTRPVLAVVDYAAAKAEMLQDWLSELTHHPALKNNAHPKLRLLLLERYGDPETPWWRQAFGEGMPAAKAIHYLLAPGAPVTLGPIADPGQRFALFAETYNLACGCDPPSVADLDQLLQVQSLGGEPLFLAMSGLIAARIGLAPALAQAPDTLAIELARQELGRVRSIWSGRGLPVSQEKRLDQHLVAMATLCEGLPEEEAHAIIERESMALHLPVQGGTEPIRAALHAALPAEAGGIAPVLPDILGEAAMIVAWGNGKQGVEAVRRAAIDHEDAVRRTVMRAIRDFGSYEPNAPRVWLGALRRDADDVEKLRRVLRTIPDSVAISTTSWITLSPPDNAPTSAWRQVALSVIEELPAIGGASGRID